MVTEGLFHGSGWPHYKYDAENDELYPDIVFGGGNGPGIVAGPDRIEQEVSELKLYEIVGYKESYGAICAAGMDVQLDPEAQCQQREINYELSEQTILEHKEDFSEFCWVFEQQGDGRCILKEVTKLR